jgi:maltose O-acetyltransferase
MGAPVFIKQIVTIGDNSVIGAHSVVIRDVPSFSIAVGVPAIVKRKIDA